MEWTSVNDLREKFLSFFEGKSHTRLPSFPLVPQGDPSLLLINSGMAPMKKYFLGLETPPNKRVTTCQKCIRTPDIERVGHTARHGTYFEMLGNFSFGDYFKREAIGWAWEFFTEVLRIPKEKLHVSVYLDDDEAYDIWTKEIGVDPSHMVRLGKEDNFWEHGSGPCGPCSEIYFDRGSEKGCGSPDCHVGCDCDRYVEIWNIVFSQFDSDGAGNYAPMEHPNIDTGMGLERLACVMQGVENLFEVDTVQNIMKHISRIAGVEYGADDKTDISLRVITDHIRSTTFMIADGILPENEGRGYVLRRLLRRAARHGKLLGIDRPFLHEVAATVIAENRTAYPELSEHADYIAKVISAEEERFSRTLNQGMDVLFQLIDRLDTRMEKMLSGEQAFKLYDTFGFPIDLTREIVQEKGISIDEERFQKLMHEQRVRARRAREAQGGSSWGSDLLADLSEPQEFTGYSTLCGHAMVMAIVCGDARVEQMTEGQEGVLVLRSTPFYAESGGQVGDTGVIRCGDSLFEVQDCKKSATGYTLHIGTLLRGQLSVGAEVETQVDTERREAIRRNHSACHLLQYALRKVLGTHVHQAGSMVNETRCRFDFSHFEAMTPEQIEKTEQLVNEMIFAALPVEIREMPVEEAKKTGAMALFGEKYADIVRVCSMGGKSIELCGGTHVGNTMCIGLFKIVSESSVAAGVRRIEAATGYGVYQLLRSVDAMLEECAGVLKLQNTAELPQKLRALSAESREKDHRIAELESKIAASQVKDLFENAAEVEGTTLLVAGFAGVKPDVLRQMIDRAREIREDAVAIFYSTSDNKASIAVGATKKAIEKGIHSGKLVKEITSRVGGSGGGRPDSAMGGATEIFRIDEVMAQLPDILRAMMKK
ncbi:MAG: alanine--tRNA ligase [Provencibacterium sp.]|nr:alanine--tRNA ligase [Provencibacterium sp.]